MSISALFSTALYFSFTAELKRGFTRAQVKILAEEQQIQLPVQWREHIEILEDPRFKHVQRSQLLLEDLEAAQSALVWQLLSINGILFLLAVSTGWLLAGKTLRPIEKVHEDQRQFIADASHELRTPITALKTSLEVFLLQKKQTIKEARTLVSGSLVEVESLQYLVDKLLRLTLYQGSRRQVTMSTFSIDKLVKKSTKTIVPLALEKGLTLQVVGEAGEIQADKEKIHELLTILLENAVKYTQEGQVSVAVTTSKKYLTLAVRDTGTGISKKDQACVFKRFYRADQSRTYSGTHGFGLGLAVAKEIVDMHQGSIQLDSKVGRGSVFTVTLPLKQH